MHTCTQTHTDFLYKTKKPGVPGLIKVHISIYVSALFDLSIYVKDSVVIWSDVIVKSHYEEVIVVITRVRGGAEDECNNNDNLRVQ